MTREFAKQQLARIQAFWPSLPATSAAVDEFMRALGPYTDTEIEAGVSLVIDNHTEQSAPKLGHVRAAVRAYRPRTYDTATEEERDLLFLHHRTAEELRIREEFEPLEKWLATEPDARERYEALMAQLLAGWAPEGIATGRKALHRTVLRRAYDERGKQTLQPVKVMP